MKRQMTRFLRAIYLPDEWNVLALDYFQTREFLDYTERYNSCRQRYYTLFEGSDLVAGIIVYTLKLDLLTFVSIPSPYKMHIAGVPCSVSSSGFLGSLEHFQELIKNVISHEKGLFICLNLNVVPDFHDMVVGRTLPAVIIENRFYSWENYIQSLRADYRRRIMNLSHSFRGINAERTTCSRFSSEMYHQYRKVLKRSKGKLETLSFSFFKNLPANFCLSAYYQKTNLLGWYISISYKKKFSFFLGGIEYGMNSRYNTYLNILSGVLREGIERNASLIDLGQTAEIPKMRLGGRLAEKVMLGYHPNRLVKYLLKAGKGVLEYSKNFPEHNVFKD